MTADALPTIDLFVCDLSDRETLGMAPCLLCGTLGYAVEPCPCSEPPPVEHWTPDASAREVRRMLGDRGHVEFRDPLELYEGDDREEGAMLTGCFDLLDLWAAMDVEGVADV